MNTSIATRPNNAPPLLDASTMADWPFGYLEPFSYDFLMVDPPWPFALYSDKGAAKSPQAHYDTVSLEDIKALPVGALAKPNAALMLWITAPLLFDAANPGRSPVGEVLSAWGFSYGSVGGWAKKTKNGKNRWGTGYWMRSGMELFILAYVGSPGHSKGCLNLIDGLAREHSRKPEEAFAWAEKYMPGGRFAEIFSRQSRPGWDCWGHEVGKFDQPLENETAVQEVISGSRI